MLIVNYWKRQLTEEIQLPNQERIRTLEKKGKYKYLEEVTKKQAEMKEKVRIQCRRQAKKFLDTKLTSRNFIKEINTLGVSLVSILQGRHPKCLFQDHS